MEIIEWCALIAVGCSIAYSIHMAHKYEESRMQMERASVRMRQLEDMIYENGYNRPNDTVELEYMQP